VLSPCCWSFLFFFPPEPVDENAANITFIQWLASVTERINQTMHFQFSGKPDPLVFHVPQVDFFFVLLVGYEGNVYNLKFYFSQFTYCSVLRVIKSRRLQWAAKMDRRSKYMQQFNVYASVHRKNIQIYIQQDATLHSLFIYGNCSTCFGWYHHPSSGAQTTVSTASGICHTVTATCCYICFFRTNKVSVMH
jgi:hypothetical protein